MHDVVTLLPWWGLLLIASLGWGVFGAWVAWVLLDDEDDEFFDQEDSVPGGSQ